MDFFQGRNRSRVVVVVTSDGRHRTVPLRDLEPQGVFPANLLRSLLAGLDGLLELLLITGSRGENGGTRRDGRR